MDEDDDVAVTEWSLAMDRVHEQLGMDKPDWW